MFTLNSVIAIKMKSYMEVLTSLRYEMPFIEYRSIVFSYALYSGSVPVAQWYSFSKNSHSLIILIGFMSKIPSQILLLNVCTT